MPELDAFLEDLSSGAPVPGGGSVAALSVALGAALLVMVANLTLGRKRYQAVQEQVDGLKVRAEAVRARARRLAQDDEAAYQVVSVAMKMPRDTEEAAELRTLRVQEALKGAAFPPLETLRAASETLDLALELARVGNRSAISDVGSAALMAVAGYRAAALNVEINLVSIQDEAWVRATRERMGTIAPPEERNAAVQSMVLAAIRGEAQ